jgi:hypothetical protein
MQVLCEKPQVVVSVALIGTGVITDHDLCYRSTDVNLPSACRAVDNCVCTETCLAPRYTNETMPQCNLLMRPVYPAAGCATRGVLERISLAGAAADRHAWTPAVRHCAVSCAKCSA